MRVLVGFLGILLYFIVVVALAWVTYRFSRRRGLHQDIARLLAVLVFVIALSPAWWRYFFNPLPKDEQMIAQFQAHREDFEALVQHYRAFTPPPNLGHDTQWDKLAEVQGKMRRAGVERLSSVGTLWMPNPYSAETAKRVDYMVRHPKELDFDPFVRYGNIQVKLSPYESYKSVVLGLYGLIWKDLWYFPEVPRVEDGKLWAPVDSKGRSLTGTRVFESLNAYPPGWSGDECVLRRIEPQWFIRMCAAY